MSNFGLVFVFWYGTREDSCLSDVLNVTFLSQN